MLAFVIWLRTFNLRSHSIVLCIDIMAYLIMAISCHLYFWATFSICSAPAFHGGLLALEGVNGNTLRLGNVVAAGVAARAMAIVPAHLSRSVGGGHGF